MHVLGNSHFDWQCRSNDNDMRYEVTWLTSLIDVQ